MSHADLLPCLWGETWAYYHHQMQGWQQWTVSERCSFFHPLLLPLSHEYIYHIYPCGFYFSLAWGWVAPNPKNLYLIRNFPELSYAVSFDQWALCRGPMTSQRTSKVPGCSAGLVNGSAVDWNIPAPANLKESEDMHRELVKEKIVQTKQIFSVQLKKKQKPFYPLTICFSVGQTTCHSGFDSSAYDGEQILRVLN